LNRRAVRALVAAVLILFVPARRPQAQQSASVAFLAVDLRTNSTLASERPDRIDRPIAPGSVMKIVALAAAFESGVIDQGSAIACNRVITVDGHRLTCTHPDLHRPLKAGEALAHSCNTFFATVAARVPRASFDRALADLGLPSSDPRHPIAAAALGIEGIRATPRQLLMLLARVTAEPTALPWRATTLAAIRAGLHDAARIGTASALGAGGIDALAKTGTVLGADGLMQGVVAGVTPSVRPSIGFVLVASGGAGLDAAALASDRLGGLARASAAASPRLQIGIVRPSGGYDVQSIPVEEYVARVVAGEAAAGSAPAALDALAVAVRTFAMANVGRHAREGFDLCDLTHCQVPGRATAASRVAAARTAGRVLRDGDRVASIYYTASCGGHTARPSTVWPGAGDPPFLPSTEDDACRGEPAWSSEITVADLKRALGAGGFKGDVLRGVSVSRRNESGRAAWLTLDGLVPHEISGEDLRTLVGRTLGWQHIRSTLFDVRRTGGGFRFSGHGAGHGVGLCVIGAAHLAEKGLSADVILARYFPGLTSHSPEVVVVLPASDRADESAIQGFALRSINDLASRLALTSPPRVTLRFLPTVEAYERETGQRWFTAASTAATDIRLLPLPVLRERGLFESTLRHELVHVLTDATLKDRPRWVREGLAMYFAGETSGAASAVKACPSDDDFRRADSREALRRVYAESAACVAARIRNGVTWNDMR
jgi:stage II sporulation protein D